MIFKLWYGENRLQADYIVENTVLREHEVEYQEIYPNNNKSFTKNPDALKKILFLDKPDIIITSGNPIKPIVSIELTSAAGTGHALLQRIPRVVAAAESHVPVAYLMPEKVWVTRENDQGGWDQYNPLIFKALLDIGRFHEVPIMAFIWDASEDNGDTGNKKLIVDSDPEFPNMPDRTLSDVKCFFDYINLTIDYFINNKDPKSMLFEQDMRWREAEMWRRYYQRLEYQGRGMLNWSPFTSTKLIKTIDFLRIVKNSFPDAEFGTLISSRDQTIVYRTSTFRGDPYAGALATIDYLYCRNGPSYENRNVNLVIEFPGSSMSDMLSKATSFYKNNCPFRHKEVKEDADAIYLMLHLRDGCRYSKQKEIRTFCYFADGLIFNDGALYRYG